MQITAPFLILLLTASFLFLAATNIQGGWLYVVDAALWSVILLSVLVPLLQLGHLQLQRHFPSKPFAGADVKIILTLRNSRNWPRAFIHCHELPVRCSRSGQVITLEKTQYFIPWLGSGESLKLEYFLPKPTAGVWIFEGFRLCAWGPFGLMGVVWRQKQLQTLVVLPCPPRDGVNLLTHEFLQAIQHIRQRSSFLEDISHFRDYQPGDLRRSIHWRNTARQGRLIVAEIREQSFQQVLVLIDTHMDQERAAFLRCVEAAEKICYHLLELHMEIACFAQSAHPAFWHRYALAPPPRQLHAIRHWEDVSYWLATLEMDASISLLQTLKAHLLDFRQWLIVMLSSHPPDEALLSCISQGRAESGLPPVLLYTVYTAPLPIQFQGLFTQIDLSAST